MYLYLIIIIIIILLIAWSIYDTCSLLLYIQIHHKYKYINRYV